MRGVQANSEEGSFSKTSSLNSGHVIHTRLPMTKKIYYGIEHEHQTKIHKGIIEI
jgi:hypothetical protein